MRLVRIWIAVLAVLGTAWSLAIGNLVLATVVLVLYAAWSQVRWSLERRARWNQLRRGGWQ